MCSVLLFFPNVKLSVTLTDRLVCKDANAYVTHEAIAMSYRAVKTACRYDLPLQRHLGTSKSASSKSNVRVGVC